MLDQLGYKRYIIKTDQEPSIMELKDSIIRIRGEEAIPEESPVQDSRSNGFIERAVQTVQGQIRTLKSAVESRLDQEVADDHPALPWMVMHASSVINRYQRDFNGATAYRKVKGKDYRQ